MTKEEYKNRRDALKKEYENAQRRLDYQFAEGNNKVKVGDYITDHYHTIRVSTWGLYYQSYNDPSLVYSGIQCKKNGEPMKNPSEEDVYQVNLKYINGEPV